MALIPWLIAVPFILLIVFFCGVSGGAFMSAATIYGITAGYNNETNQKRKNAMDKYFFWLLTIFGSLLWVAFGISQSYSSPDGSDALASASVFVLYLFIAGLQFVLGYSIILSILIFIWLGFFSSLHTRHKSWWKFGLGAFVSPWIYIFVFTSVQGPCRGFMCIGY